MCLSIAIVNSGTIRKGNKWGQQGPVRPALEREMFASEGVRNLNPPPRFLAMGSIEAGPLKFETRRFLIYQFETRRSLIIGEQACKTCHRGRSLDSRETAHPRRRGPQEGGRGARGIQGAATLRGGTI